MSPTAWFLLEMTLILLSLGARLRFYGELKARLPATSWFFSMVLLYLETEYLRNRGRLRTLKLDALCALSFFSMIAAFDCAPAAIAAMRALQVTD